MTNWSDVPGMIFGFDANDSPVTLDATEKWPRATAAVDLSGAGNDLAEVGGKGPLIVDWRGGNKAFRTKSGGAFLSRSTFVGGAVAAFTAYIVGEWTAGTGTEQLFDAGGSTNRVMVRNSTAYSGVTGWGGTAFDGTSGQLRNQPFLLRLHFPGNGTCAVYCEVHGGEIIVDTLTGLGSNALNGFTLMANYDGASNFWGGRVACCGIYAGDTTALDANFLASLKERYEIRTIEEILGASWRESFIWPGVNSATATAWTGVKGRVLTGAGTNSRVTGKELAGSLGFSANADGYVLSAGAGGYYSDDAGLGDLVAGASAPAWTVAIAYRADTVIDDIPVFGWSQTSNPDTSFLNACYGSGALKIAWQSDADDSTVVSDVFERVTKEEFVIVSYDGDSTMRVWRAGELVREDTSFSPTGAFAAITRFQVGAQWNGSATVGARLGIGVKEIHIASAGISLEQAALLNEYFASNATSYRPNRLAERLKLIGSDTPGWDELGGTAGENIMFPCVLRTRHSGALAPYAMLMGGHEDQQIYLAHSDSLTSGWEIYGAGTDWTYAALLAATGASAGALSHISSPHVVWDAENERYIGWGHHRTAAGHNSHVAFSTDLIHWTIQSNPGITNDTNAGHYLRPFQVGGVWYAIGNVGVLFRSSDPAGLSGYVAATNQTVFAAGVRIRNLQVLHCGTELLGTTLVVYFTLALDNPGRLWMATCDVSGDWQSWALTGAVQFIEPRADWEGDDQPFLQAASSVVHDPTRQLRDPHIFIDDDETKWLVYTVRGEDGIGILPFPWLDGIDLTSGMPTMAPGSLSQIQHLIGFDLTAGFPTIDAGTILPPLAARIVNLTYKWRATQSTGTPTAAAPAFTAYRGHALDMGVFTVSGPAGFEFTDTVAQLRIGRIGDPAHVEWRSDDVPSGVLFAWDTTTGELAIDMPSSEVDQQLPGRYVYQLTIISSSGEPLGPPLDNTFRILPVVGAMA